MGKKSKTPKTPNFTGIGGVVEKQEAANKKAWETGVQANRPNQFGPSGSSTWEQDPTSGQWSQTTAFNQPQQDIFNTQQGNQQALANNIGGMMGKLDTSQIDLSQAPGMADVADYGSLAKTPSPVDYSKLTSRPEVGGFDQRSIDTINALQRPDLDRARNRKESQLAAMGIGTGTGNAWNTEQGNLADSENRAGLNAILAGIQQGNTMFGQQAGLYGQDINNLNSQFAQGMAGRQQGVNELNTQFGQGMQRHTTGTGDILNQRAGNLGQLSGLMGLGQNLTTPQFQNVGNVGQYNAADLLGATNAQYNAALDKTNAANADSSNNMNALGTIGSIGASIF